MSEENDQKSKRKQERQSNSVHYTQKTRIGYWAISFVTFFLGVLFSSYNQIVQEYGFLSVENALFMFKCFVICFPTYLFYKSFFDIYSIYSDPDSVKTANTSDVKTDIDSNNQEETRILDELEVQQQTSKKAIGAYSFAILFGVLILLLIFFYGDKGTDSLSFVLAFALYNIAFLLLTRVYSLLINHEIHFRKNRKNGEEGKQHQIPKFFETVFGYVLPTIFTIGYSSYFGLSISKILAFHEDYTLASSLPVLYPIIVAIVYLVYLNVKMNKRYIASLKADAIIIIVSALVPAIISILLKNNLISRTGWLLDQIDESLTNLYISVGMSTFLGIYEGWHFLVKLKRLKSCTLEDFCKRYNTINILMVVCPIIFYTICFIDNINQGGWISTYFILFFTAVVLYSFFVWVKYSGRINKWFEPDGSNSWPRKSVSGMKFSIGFWIIFAFLLERTARIIFQNSSLFYGLQLNSEELPYESLISIALMLVSLALGITGTVSFNKKVSAEENVGSKFMKVFWQFFSKSKPSYDVIIELSNSGGSMHIFAVIFSYTALIYNVANILFSSKRNAASLVVSLIMFLLAIGCWILSSYLSNHNDSEQT